MARGSTSNNDPQHPTMEEMMALINGLREENTRSREREEAIQRENEEIRRRADEMQAMIAANTKMTEEDVMMEVPRDFRPFSEAIEAETIPRDHRVPQVEPFDGTQDPSQHLKDFRAQMLICGGSMGIRCKLFMGTLKKAALDWFSGLPDRSITDFDVFSQLFMAQFAANKKKSPIKSDLFDLKQKREESLKNFLQRFNEVALRIASLDERMAVIAFQKGLRSCAFNVALERANCQTMSEVRAFALSHIKTEEGQINERAPENREAGVGNKEDNKHLRPYSDWSKLRDRYNMKEGNHRQADYGGRKRDEWARNNEEEKFTPLNVPWRQILHDVNSASLFEFPVTTECQLGLFKTDWCEFHRTHGHTTENCFVLGRQIECLIKEGRLKKFVARKHEEGSSKRRHRHVEDGARRDKHKERSPPETPNKGVRDPSAAYSWGLQYRHRGICGKRRYLNCSEEVHSYSADRIETSPTSST
ncbi:uncharacterized protein LOC109815201 [Cajanus cajan]|uniref:uncharacterized protein LOC109815201 n=1 Tax=Cajanus cajan TaxID=3821 RepID=UPI00098DB5C1|nr:uncharacterized protein LOC109815201 [Cajanus cajan]